MPPPDIDLTPSVPYFELPAGLVAPLVKVRYIKWVINLVELR